MRLSINLYSTSAPVDMKKTIQSCMALIDYSLPFEVSRTVGPANYYEIEKRLLEDETTTQIQPTFDVYRKKCNKVNDLLDLVRDDSTVQAHFTFCRSELLSTICRQISKGFPQGFFSSDASFAFGPTDVIRLTESGDGEYQVDLIDVAMTQFLITTDNFWGDPSDLAKYLASCRALQEFKSGLEEATQAEVQLLVLI